jgi:hypothetical protein
MVLSMTSTHLRRVDAVLVPTIAVSSLLFTGTLLEVVTDRHWSVRGWEWPEVLVAASVLALGRSCSSLSDARQSHSQAAAQ